MNYCGVISFSIGVTKCFGEALCRYMAEKEAVPSIAVRIGAFQPHENAKDKDSLDMMDAWLSERDCVQLLERCIDVNEDLKFAIVHGLSRNTFNRMEIESTRQLLGYDPQDNFFEESERFKHLNMTDQLAGHNLKYVEIWIFILKKNEYLLVVLETMDKSQVYEKNHQIVKKNK